MSRHIYIPIVSAALLVAAPAAVADYFTTVPSAPDNTLNAPGLEIYNVGGGQVLLRNMEITPHPGAATTPISPVQSPSTFTVSSFFDIFTELSTDGGQNWYPASGTALTTIQESGPTSGTFNTEMTQLDLSGTSANPLVPFLKLRESPTSASTGQTTITPAGGGEFRVSSFFDIFTELSIDGGNTWTPNSAPGGFARADATPEPASLALLAPAALLLFRRRKS